MPGRDSRLDGCTMPVNALNKIPSWRIPVDWFTCTLVNTPITEGNSHNAVTRIFELQRFSKRGRPNDAVTAQQNTVTVTSEEELTT